MKWQILITLGTIFFVLGQICLKYDVSNTPYQTLFYFTFASGLIGFCGLLVTGALYEKPVPWIIILAGVLFFFGNGFWIAGIQQVDNVGILRVFMAGLETILLLLAAYIVFAASVTYKELLSICIILSGIYLLNN